MRSPSASSSRLPTVAPTAEVQTRTFAAPFIILVCIVLASAIQTEAANYLAQGLGFNKPYFSFFITHVAFAAIFPIHLGILAVAHAHGFRGSWGRARQLLRNLRAVLADQLGTPPRWRQLARPLTRKIVPLTLLVSFPSICWYVAMALSPAMDITALYATSAFHTYFFSLLLLGTRLTKITVAAIAVAFAGVIVITFEDAGKEGKSDGESRSRLVGDIIMVVGAAGLGLYEVVYKMVLPEGEGGAHRHTAEHAASPVAQFSALPEAADEDDEDDDNRIALSGPAGSRTPLLVKTNGSASANGSRSSSPASRTSHSHSSSHTNPHAHVPHLPAAFHSNFLTSCLGLGTIAFLWIPFPFLHVTGIEEFVLPNGSRVWTTLIFVASMGAIYVS
jgi:drug/metabolite transporter (DMT)-like permease